MDDRKRMERLVRLLEILDAQDREAAMLRIGLCSRENRPNTTSKSASTRSRAAHVRRSTVRGTHERP
jgi:hypothetical protein